MDTHKQRPKRIFYAAGPGDVIGTYRHWCAGRDDPSQVAQTYSGQFYSVCRDLGFEAFVVSSHPRRDRFQDATFRIEHRPDPSIGARGFRYHFFSLLYLFRLLRLAIFYRADAMVVSNVDYWFVLRVLRPFGIKVIPVLHCVLWPKYRKPKGLGAWKARLNVSFFHRFAAATMYISEDVAAQLQIDSMKSRPRFFPFFPTFIQGSMEITDPPASPPFRVCFSGRIEQEKGVFDLLEICKRFKARGRSDIEFLICGDGSASAALRAQAVQAGVGDRFIFHGQLDREALVAIYHRCNAIVVPTRTDFIEGMNKVVLEGVLCGRPVITSDVCPAVAYLSGAVEIVPADDIDAYENTILKLADDAGYYRERCEACRGVGCAFYDQSNGWGATLKRALFASKILYPLE